MSILRIRGFCYSSRREIVQEKKPFPTSDKYSISITTKTRTDLKEFDPEIKEDLDSSKKRFAAVVQYYFSQQVCWRFSRFLKVKYIVLKHLDNC